MATKNPPFVFVDEFPSYKPSFSAGIQLPRLITGGYFWIVAIAVAVVVVVVVPATCSSPTIGHPVTGLMALSSLQFLIT